MQALRSAARQTRPALRQVRRMSSENVNYAEEAKESHKWKIISFAALPIIAGMTFWNLSHAHHHEPNPNYPYMHIRNKDFPWGSDNLFVLKHEE